MDDFKLNIKNWVQLDNNISEKNNEIKEMKLQKQHLYDNIMEYVDENNLDTTTISISDGSLKFNKGKQIQPLTLSFIQSCLSDLIDSEEQVDVIMKHIKSSRTYKVTNEIKRYKK